MQYCRIISLDNNNLVKFTSSRGDNSITNDSLVKKIAHERLHMYKNIMYKFQTSTCKTVGEKHRTKLCPRADGGTDGRTVMVIPVYPPPLHCGGYNYFNRIITRVPRWPWIAHLNFEMAIANLFFVTFGEEFVRISSCPYSANSPHSLMPCLLTDQNFMDSF